MKLSDLELITILSDEGNMRKASERLFVSQPALSQRLQYIEREWNTQLFVRSKRGVALTAEGELVERFARETLERAAETRAELQAHESEIHGTLKLAVSSVNGQYWLPDVLKTFVESHPLVKISLTTGWSSEILKQMYRADCHAAIVRGTPKWGGGKVYLFSDPLNFVDSKISTLEELKNEERPYIQFRSDSSYDQIIQNWWHSQNLRLPVRTIMVDQIETCKQMVTHGIGYAVLPSISLTERDTVNKILLLDHQNQPIVRENWLLYDREALHLDQVLAFVNLVKHRLFS
ncbi:LysR family transcriptional regulator [Sporolactobacillus nakayamae]|uniref:DNA-binding transcriptional regulator, LysR family n=1 Tax=Sporolactobacillus nakayamae TaxID=269670 RepID=A0A1I2RC14_9BACL|nr:LysR family transcriptional regulator [Sporolactobacillus nakayamae]SFG38068.1 DNA-binding transcriptional regulator, LysR family [Sporolactobacillus nakayamae]